MALVILPLPYILFPLVVFDSKITLPHDVDYAKCKKKEKKEKNRIQLLKLHRLSVGETTQARISRTQGFSVSLAISPSFS